MTTSTGAPDLGDSDVKNVMISCQIISSNVDNVTSLLAEDVDLIDSKD